MADCDGVQQREQRGGLIEKLVKFIWIYLARQLKTWKINRLLVSATTTRMASPKSAKDVSSVSRARLRVGQNIWNQVVNRPSGFFINGFFQPFVL